MVGALTRTRAALSYAAKSLALALAIAVVATGSLPAGAAPITPISPIPPITIGPVPAAPPAGTAPASTPVDGLPVCLPGQESAPVSGAGTPAPLGVLEGLPADVKAGGTFAGVKLDAEQVTMAATVVAVGKQMGITRRGIEIALAVATEQSSLRPEAINQDWLGLFQQNPVTYTQYRRTEPGGAAWMFYDQLIKQVPGYDSDPRQNYEIGDVVQKTTTGERFAEYQDMSADFVGRLTDAVSLHQDDVTCTPAPAAQAATGSNFDPGNIISDQVFYNTTAMTVDQIRVFIRAEGEACVGPYCLKNLSLTTPNQPADRYCAAYQGGTNEDAATVIAKFSAACGINPQVMLVTLQKESGLLSRTDVSAATYNAAWGWHCPDTGPGGSANCDPAYAGFFNQGYGMAKQWSRYKLDPAKYNYQAGQTVNIMWNVAESGCGSAPVSIKNQATASLYIYTPYQPNAAALAAYPGTGDSCSAYGNRNFFFMFRKYFGSTGGGSSTTGAATTVSAVLATGTAVKIPNNQYVSAALAGQTITAPNAAVAAGLAAGFSALGLPYVWGGGGSGAGPNNGCARGGGDYNSCGSTIGFDCSGLTAYVLGMAGYQTPGDSGSQRAAGQSISWAEAVPGDIVGFPGHVAIYLGTFGGRPYILEASWVGTPIHIVPLTRTDVDDRVHRYWAGPAVAAPRVADFSSIVSSFGSTGSYTLSGGSPSAGSGNRAGGSTGYVSRIPQIRPLAYPAPVVLPVPQPVPVAPVPPPEAPLPVAPTLVAPPPVSPPPPVDPPVTQPAPPVTEPVTEPTVAEPPVTETSTSTTEVTVERVAPSSTTAPTASSLSAQSPTESTGSSTADRRSPASAIPTPTATTTTVGSTPGSSTAAGSSSAQSTATTANKPRPAATTAPGSGRPTTTGATTTASPPVSSVATSNSVPASPTTISAPVATTAPEATATEPTPVIPPPTSTDAVPAVDSAPTGTDPTGTEPTTTDPATTDPTGNDVVIPDPAPADPTAPEPTTPDPAPACVLPKAVVPTDESGQPISDPAAIDPDAVDPDAESAAPDCLPE